MRDKGYSAAAVRKTLDTLVEQGCLDDRRFALNWGRSRVASKTIGPYRLRRELAAKGLPESVVDSTVETLYQEHDEPGLARTCAAKKLAGLERLDRDKQRRRLAQHLQRKGFSAELVYQTVQQLVPGRSRGNPAAPTALEFWEEPPSSRDPD
ncbi:MAG: RecX family transcriptional regulator [Nitrospinaceae bacterium]|nr:RecX family transcriptional regulator [Nitrospinaceae bacterium]